MKSNLTPSIKKKLRETGKTCTCFHLRKASRVVTQLFDEEMHASGLRGTQFTLLVAIALSGTASITELAETLVTDRTTLTRNLKPLEHQKLLSIMAGADRRTRAVTLTAKGQEKLSQALPLWTQAQKRVVSHLGLSRWDSLMKNLRGTVKTIQSA